MTTSRAPDYPSLVSGGPLPGKGHRSDAGGAGGSSSVHLARRHRVRVRLLGSPAVAMSGSSVPLPSSATPGFPPFHAATRRSTARRRFE
jgi:hypothetical protein